VLPVLVQKLFIVIIEKIDLEMVEEDIAVAPVSEMVPVTEMFPVALNINEKGTNIFANIYRM
jgi:hypothetical protein